MHCVEYHAATEDLHNAVMPADIFRLFNQLCRSSGRSKAMGLSDLSSFAKAVASSLHILDNQPRLAC